MAMLFLTTIVQTHRTTSRKNNVQCNSNTYLKFSMQINQGRRWSTAWWFALLNVLDNLEHPPHPVKRHSAGSCGFYADVCFMLATDDVARLLLGDLNAMTRTDYTEEEWQVLEERNKESNWSPPATGCLDALTSAGFTDVFAAAAGVARLAERGVDQDGTRPPIFSAHVGHPLYRIDYLFQGDGLAGVLAPAAAHVAVDMALSDHFPVVFDLMHKPPLASM